MLQLRWWVFAAKTSTFWRKPSLICHFNQVEERGERIQQNKLCSENWWPCYKACQPSLTEEVDGSTWNILKSRIQAVHQSFDQLIKEVGDECTSVALDFLDVACTLYVATWGYCQSPEISWYWAMEYLGTDFHGLGMCKEVRCSTSFQLHQTLSMQGGEKDDRCGRAPSIGSQGIGMVALERRSKND